MKNKKPLYLIGVYIFATIFAVLIAFPEGLLPSLSLLTPRSDENAPDSSGPVVAADLFYRTEKYENIFDPSISVVHRDSRSFLTRFELLALRHLPEPAEPAPPLVIPPGCEISTNLGYETHLFTLINAEREKRGLTLLTWNAELSDAARKHSVDMACNDFFSHVNPEGESFEARIRAEGYRYYALGENIYAGDEVFNSPYRAFRAWFYSTDHFVVMTHSVFTEVGVGYVYNPDSRYGGYFTADFGTPE